MQVIGSTDEQANAAQADAGDGGTTGLGAAGGIDLHQRNDAEGDGQDRGDEEQACGNAQNAKDQRGRGIAVGRALLPLDSAFKREGNATGPATVGRHRVQGVAADALDCQCPSSVVQNLWGAIAGGRVGVNRMGIGFDDLVGIGVNQPAVAIEDGDADIVGAGGALAVLASREHGGFEAAAAPGAIEPEAANGFARAAQWRRRRRTHILALGNGHGGRGALGHFHNALAGRTAYRPSCIFVVHTERRFADMTQESDHPLPDIISSGGQLCKQPAEKVCATGAGACSPCVSCESVII